MMHREALVANSSAGLVRVVFLSSLAATVTKATGHCAFVQWVARCVRPLAIRLSNGLARLFAPNP